VLLFCSHLELLSAQTLGENDEGVDEKDSRPEKRIIVYNDLKRPLKELCEYIAEDGRRDALVVLLTSLTAVDPNCAACKPFFRSFVAACRAPKVYVKRKKKREPPPELEEGETPPPTPTPVPTPHELEPNIRVLDFASQVFTALSEDSRRLDDNYQAAMKFATALRSPQGKTTAEHNYYSTLAEYVLAPFEPYAEIVKRRELSSPRKAAELPPADISDLF